ncbi:MAG: GNAT family N-acetyltransferase [Clostridia bacterium]|nr:GNAT family N-acetyltransferase [Clostridia bacterium]
MNFQSLFEVRLANKNDVDAIIDITKEAFKSYINLAGIPDTPALNETPEDVLKDLQTKLVLIALADETPVGCVRLEIFDDNTAYLSRFAVRTTSQNNGIGKSIMNLVDKIMIDKGIKEITLHTGSKITSLVRFYYGRGFFIDSTDKSKGYVRACLKKEYK